MYLDENNVILSH